MSTAAGKIRDARRSRGAILMAAEQLFAAQGYDRTSLSDIGAAAGLSRGSPGYLFGSKAELYAEVLRGAFAARQEATSRAFAPVLAWCDGEEGADALGMALFEATQGYMRFLLEHDSFVALIMREELEAGERIQASSGLSRAITTAFTELRRAGARRGVRRFPVAEAVVLFVALTLGPVSYRRTLLPAQGVDLSAERVLRRHAKLAAEQMMFFLQV
ncbi:MAG: TetR/AcrR family transcriptional regulator [Solirubrobacteraceae bacterium]